MKDGEYICKVESNEFNPLGIVHFRSILIRCSKCRYYIAKERRCSAKDPSEVYKSYDFCSWALPKEKKK